MSLDPEADSLSRTLPEESDGAGHPLSETPAEQLPEDLRGADLSNRDLRGARLAGRDLRGANLTAADLSEADLSGADLAGARLAGAVLTGAVAHEAILRGADLRAASAAGLRGRDIDLERADLSGADLSGAHLAAASLIDARLSGAKLLGADLEGAELRGADLRDADFSTANLSRADLRGARVGGTIFEEARLTGAKAQGLRDASEALVEALRLAGASGGLALDRAGVEGAAGRVLERLTETARSLAPTRLLSRWTSAGRQEAGRANATALGGPGSDLRDRALAGQNLCGAQWAGCDLSDTRLEESRLEGADLREARLDRTRLDSAVLRGAMLTGAGGEHVRLVDADLRDADLRDIALGGADLSGADLRGARLAGANLRGAKLRGARLSDLVLEGVNLDEADLDQADVSGVDWSTASISAADLSGALGLSESEREALTARGARTGVDGGGVITARWARAGLALAALGMGVYLATRFLAPGSVETSHLAEEAEALRDTDPASAAKKYEELAAASDRPEDRVGHRLEAATLAEKAGEAAEAERLLKDALDAASTDEVLSGRARLALSRLLSDQKRWTELREVAHPLLELQGQPSADRAQGLMLYEDAVAASGETGDALASVWEKLADLPEAEADLRVAMAEARANRGDNDKALAHLDRLAAMSLPEEVALQSLSTRARVLDRMGRIEDATAAYESLLKTAPEGSLPGLAARLSLADLKRRQGQPEGALELLAPLLEEGADTRLAGRALLLAGGLEEDAGELVASITDYRRILELSGLDLETVEEARISLARLLLASEGEESARAVLAGLSDEVAAAVLSQARLGEARRLLDSGQAEEARRLFDEIERASQGAPKNGGSAEVIVLARSGRAEALSSLGDLPAAITLWQELLRGPLTAQARDQVELLLGHAQLQRGQREAASEVFARLAASQDPDTRAQGRLGQAAAARGSGARETARGIYREVARNAEDPSWRVEAIGELAEMAEEDGRPDEALVQWRALLGVVPPGHPAAVSARLALVGALEESGKVDEALRACNQAAAAASGEDRSQARVACAELIERHKPTEARAAWEVILADSGAGEDARTDAALGVARAALASGDSAGAARAADTALTVARRPELRIGLLAARASALRSGGDTANAEKAERELESLASRAPEAAARYYTELASGMRRAGNDAEAAAALGRALSLSPPQELKAGIALQLGEILLDRGDATGAKARFQEAAKAAAVGSEEALAAGLGLAAVEQRTGQIPAALSRLRALEPADPEQRGRWLEAMGSALGEAGDPGAAAVWAELQKQGGADASTQGAALRGQAEAALSAGDGASALALYEQAAGIATDDGERGQAALGIADAKLALGRADEATADLASLSSAPDAEVRLAATLRAARLLRAAGKTEDALSRLDSADASGLGAPWDTALTQARADTLLTLDRPDEVGALWRDLEKRWPDDEEARLPAMLGLAYLADRAGDADQARTLALRARDAAKDPGYRALAEELLANLGPAPEKK